MPYRKEEFINDGIYHIVLRGIDDNLLFKNVDDYYRGIFSIYEFNNLKPITIQEQRRARISLKNKYRRRASTQSDQLVDKREKLVDILAFCFMPNHIHLLLRQIQDNGIHDFMVKLGSGYGRYFNQKYQRKGYVFQNRFRSVIIKSNDQLMTVVNYINVNPVSLIEPNFKEKGIKNNSIKKVFAFLKEYKWSSFSDYMEVKNFPSVTERDLILEVMGGGKGMVGNVMDWLSYKKDSSLYSDILIE